MESKKAVRAVIGVVPALASAMGEYREGDTENAVNADLLQ